MKSLGIVRKVDELGRIVLPIETRKRLELAAGDGVEIFVENSKYVRKTNNAGGIESGITNGEDIIIKASMKAIPTMKKALNSIAIDKKEEVQAHFERSDTCAVSACAVVAEAMAAIVIADAMLEKFSHDNIDEMKKNYSNYLERVSER